MNDKASIIFDDFIESLEKFSKNNSSCNGERCTQFVELKTKVNTFISIIIVLITVLISVSTCAYVKVVEVNEKVTVNKEFLVKELNDMDKKYSDKYYELDKKIIQIKP